MNEHPILFSTEMIRAILDGRKTQTRRVIKPQYPKFSHGFGGCFFCGDGDDGIIEVAGVLYCPYGVPGDTLWVREMWAMADNGHTYYRADYPASIPMRATKLFGGTGWKPSIHMPRSASRLTLEVINVRVERVQEISEEDAIAEGVASVDLFASLWDTINAKRGYAWDTNPWVWVVEFKVQR